MYLTVPCCLNFSRLYYPVGTGPANMFVIIFVYHLVYMRTILQTLNYSKLICKSFIWWEWHTWKPYKNDTNINCDISITLSNFPRIRDKDSRAVIKQRYLCWISLCYHDTKRYHRIPLVSHHWSFVLLIWYMKMPHRKYQHFVKISWRMFPEIIIYSRSIFRIYYLKYNFYKSLFFYNIGKK